MKNIILLLTTFFSFTSFSQSATAPNIFIITTDGFRWREIFNGADSLLISNPHFVNDTALLKEMYWNNDLHERRKLLMPFVWKTIEKNGSLYGNRNYENKVSVANAYRFSYAGYNEILTGFANPAVIANSKKWNQNENLLEFLNVQPEYNNAVAAFASWNLFDYILNKPKSSIYQNNGYQKIKHDSLTCTEVLTNLVQQYAVYNLQATRNDMLTFVAAKEYIHAKHPKVVFIGFGETDEYAHSGKYDEYLQAANLFDNYLAQLWYLVNRDPFYKNNTSFIITTDHGRGEKTKNWTRHGPLTSGSSDSWLMTIGPGFKNEGELKTQSEIFNDQLAQTVAAVLGLNFTTTHPVASPLQITAASAK